MEKIMTRSLIPVEKIYQKIYLMRGEKVMLDYDLAELYGVSTKVFNQAIKRNSARFPPDFRFHLSQREFIQFNRSQIVTGSQKHRDPRYLPYAFTEHGALMAANLLNSEQATQVSVTIIRAFVELRKMIASQAALTRRIDKIEKRYDQQFQTVFNVLKQLIEPKMKPVRKIGF